MNVTVMKSKNGSIMLEGDSDSIASVIGEMMQLMWEIKDRSASEREVELLAKQVSLSLILYYHSHAFTNTIRYDTVD